MIMVVTAIELASGYEGALGELTGLIQAETRHRHVGLHRITLLRDSAHPTCHLVVSEWEGHEHLAQAMRSGLIWELRDWTAEWIASPPRVYDEVVETGEIIVGGAITHSSSQRDVLS
jgi:quinol monooxygenase YgiN